MIAELFNSVDNRDKDLVDKVFQKIAQYEALNTVSHVVEKKFTEDPELESLKRSELRADIAYKRNLAGLPMDDDAYEQSGDGHFRRNALLAALGLGVFKSKIPKPIYQPSARMVGMKLFGALPDVADNASHSALKGTLSNGRSSSRYGIARIFSRL